MNDLERKEALQRELDKREAAKKSTSERQADYLTRRGRSADLVDLHVVIERGERTWGDDDERPELDGDATSRRQAARITRGASSRGGDSDA